MPPDMAMEISSSGEDYLQLPPVEEDDGGELFSHALLHALTSTTLADIVIPRVDGVTGAPDDSDHLATAVTEALKTVDAPSDETRDCPICLQDDGGMAAWKETPCGHRFHGWCVERWLLAKGSCPMCRHQVVAMPVAAASMAPHLVLEIEHSVIFEVYGQDGVNSAFMEEEE